MDGPWGTRTGQADSAHVSESIAKNSRVYCSLHFVKHLASLHSRRAGQGRQSHFRKIQGSDGPTDLPEVTRQTPSRRETRTWA